MLASVALAGCSGGGGSSPTTSPTTATTTTTESGPTLDTVTLPDGVSESGVSESLLLSHKLKTSDEAYTIERRYTNPHSNRRTKIQLGTSTAAQKQVVVSGQSKSFWKTGTVGLCRANGGSYYYHCDPTVNRSRIADYYRIRQHLQLGDYRPTSVEDGDGQTVVTAKAPSATITGALSREFSEIESYTGTLTFTPEGVIHSLSYDMTVVRPWNDRPEQSSFSWTASKFGETTVSKPSWVPQAKAKAFEFEVSGHPDGNYVTIDIVGGSGTLPSNLYVTMNNREHNFHADPDIGLSAGDTLYLGLSADSLVATTGDPLENRDDVNGQFDLRISVNGPRVIETTVTL